MKQKILMEKYPIFELVVAFDEVSFRSVDALIAYFKEKIESHPVATYIATFDHYKHTKSLEDHKMDDSIKDAKNIIFCFGKELPKPEVLAVRPRSIGVAMRDNDFVISFLEAPNEVANSAMEDWVKGICL